MSRVANNPINVPENVEINISGCININTIPGIANKVIIKQIFKNILNGYLLKAK